MAKTILCEIAAGRPCKRWMCEKTCERFGKSSRFFGYFFIMKKVTIEKNRNLNI